MKKMRLFGVAVTLLVWCASIGGVSAADNSFSIANQWSSKCLDVANGSLTDGANVQQFMCHGGDNQKWRLRGYFGGPYELINLKSGKCLDVANGSLTDGANVQQFMCHGGDNQKWNLVLWGSSNGKPTYVVVNKKSGKCLDVANGSLADGANVQQFTCHGRGNQQWFGFNFIDTL